MDHHESYEATLMITYSNNDFYVGPCLKYVFVFFHIITKKKKKVKAFTITFLHKYSCYLLHWFKNNDDDHDDNNKKHTQKRLVETGACCQNCTPTNTIYVWQGLADRIEYKVAQDR